MEKSEVFEILIEAVKRLEQSGDIVVVNPIENIVANRILISIEKYIPNMLSDDELKGIVNAIGAHQLGFALDDRDFQTIIGLTKRELEVAGEKLKNCHE
jgi:hypothetical protein